MPIKGVPLPRGAGRRTNTARKAWLALSVRQQEVLASCPVVYEYRGTVALSALGPGLLAWSVLGARIVR